MIGDKTNNEFNNLRLLCPNCHSQTNTYTGKNKKIKRIKKQEVEIKEFKLKPSNNKIECDSILKNIGMSFVKDHLINDLNFNLDFSFPELKTAIEFVEFKSNNKKQLLLTYNEKLESLIKAGWTIHCIHESENLTKENLNKILLKISKSNNNCKLFNYRNGSFVTEYDKIEKPY